MKPIGICVTVAVALAWLPGDLGAVPQDPLFDKDRYPVFPDEDAGADPSVPAEKGGKGFGKVAASLGWKTNVDFELIGDPRARKGGELIRDMRDFPGNVRPAGPQWNSMFNYRARLLLYETLLGIHPETESTIPCLATHWKVSPDGRTFSYRINPNARWADGSPVTSEDVVATHALLTDPTLGDASGLMVWSKFRRPVADGKYLVSVECAERDWRCFDFFSLSFSVFPAKELKPFKTAADWAKAFNQRFMMGSGPYEGREEDLVAGASASLRRRPGYWAASARANVGRFNFERITKVVVPEATLAFERLKKGDLHLLVVQDPRQWVVEMAADRSDLIRRGILQKRKIHNQRQQGYGGIAFNMRWPPFDDLRVRKAFTLLLDRKDIIRKIMLNQRLPQRSYFPGGAFESPGNPRNDFDPEGALQLLSEAGWKGRDASGRLVNAKGEPLEIRILHRLQEEERWLTIYQESLKQAGITATIELVRPAEMLARIQEGKYQAAAIRWGVIGRTPNPEYSFDGKIAGAPNTNNITGFSDERVDALLERLRRTDVDDAAGRRILLREIDGLLAAGYPYALDWYAPFDCLIFRDCFGHPVTVLTRLDFPDQVESLWWWEPEKAKDVEAACKDPSRALPIGPGELRPWARGAGEGE